MIFLGHKVTANGIFPDPEKVEAIVKMKEPSDKKELQRFLGMINYVGKFIPNLAEHTAPLRKLLRKTLVIDLHKSTERVLLNLKKQLHLVLY